MYRSQEAIMPESSYLTAGELFDFMTEQLNQRGESFRKMSIQCEKLLQPYHSTPEPIGPVLGTPYIELDVIWLTL